MAGNYKHNEYSYEISDDGYGKNYVKLLHINRQGQLHSIKELEVCTHLKLYTKRDYLYGKLFRLVLHFSFVKSLQMHRLIV